MLQEMGIRVFWPEPVEHLDQPPVRVAAAAVVAEPAVVAPRPAAAPSRPAATAVRAEPVEGPGAADLASLDWDQLRQSVADWAAPRRRKPVFGAGDLSADWLVIGEPPLEDEERQGEPFVGDPGKLLDNMLAALGVSRRQGAYLTNVLKCRLPQDRSGEAEDLAQSMAFLRRQVELLQPRVIVVMGRYAVQALLQSGEPLGKLRGRPHEVLGVPAIVTYPPAYLLRNLADKGRAWADLCLARSLLA
jgi:DNA polymerase